MDCLPIPFVCFQCGTDQNPCHCKVVGPTIGFASAIVLAWWEEGAETLKAFFDDEKPSEDSTDQRLEDLLDLLEPLKVGEEPQNSSIVGVTSSEHGSPPKPLFTVDTIDTSSPVFTGTTTRTRRTSLQPETSTRASSAVPDTAATLDLSPENGTIAPSSLEAPIENDPTGLQTVKGKRSDDHGLPKAIDSSILSQEDDTTVVHDPSSAAVSFFPPNPYSDEPVQYPSQQAAPTVSSVFNGQLGNDYRQDIEDTSADSSLTSLASNDDQMNQYDLRDQLADYKRYLADTPSPPPTSPLSPPPSILTTRYADPDIMGGADPEDDETTLFSIASTPSKPIIKLGKVAPKEPDDDRGLRDTGGLGTVNEADDELADDTDADDIEQQQAHEDEPAQKRLLATVTGDEKQPGTDAKAVAPPEEHTIKDRLRRRMQESKANVTSTSALRDSPDELAPESADELADPSPSHGSLSLVKSRINKSKPSRSRAKKPPNTPALAPLEKIVGVPRATRGATANRQLAGIPGTPSPRKVEENTRELRSLDATPILYTRTRTGTATAESTPEPGTQGSVKPVPKRTKFATSASEVTRLGSPTPKVTPAKTSKGAPATRKRAPRKNKTAESKQDDDTMPEKLNEATTKRKREEEDGETEEQPTRASKRIAGAEPEGE
ncbi:unnamed protein product [Aureobasidium uvarum]|uniref:Uncharacterized protein n=1 Tax=Aureobasidium uvarum TaxID=2773716 RepID=A0A9N8PVX0_9PEZI|nr:unnamed protein product [Aureobasidium uvarum]